MSTAPWSAAAASQLSRGSEHVYIVTATTGERTIPLEVDTGRLTYDESWSPHVQASFTVAIPESEADLLALDPRGLVRINITVGYVLEDRTTEQHQIASLVLRDRTVNRPANTVTLSAMSDECLVIDAGEVAQVALEYPGSQGWQLSDALRVFIERATGAAPVINVQVDGDISVELSWLEKWSELISQWSDQVGAWLHHDGLTGWVLRRRPETVATSSAQLTVGPGGTITSSQSVVTREAGEWANDVYVFYAYKAGGFDSYRVGHAWISGGEQRAYTVAPTAEAPWGTPRPGIKRITYERTGQVSSAAANAAAQALLIRRASQGRQVSLTAVSAYWLRPGATVTVQLLTGAQERHLVSSVDFRWPSGDMTVNTRLPDLAPITSGE